MRPTLTIIAGPNGSGKTTLTNALREQGVDLGDYINPDDIAAQLHGAADDNTREAQRIADARRAECLVQGRSFSFETVMSHESKLEVLRQARERGYRVVIYFVGLEDPRLNVERVRQHVLMGGHPVPEDKIISRYSRCMALLPDAVDLCDVAAIFDNSAINSAADSPGFWLVMHYNRSTDALLRKPPQPKWLIKHLRRFFQDHRQRRAQGAGQTVTLSSPRR